MDKCIIIKYNLNSRVWFLVEQDHLVLSTPLDTFEDATTWLKGLGFRIGCARLTDDVTEVTLQGGFNG